jgi:hypothetical protein
MFHTESKFSLIDRSNIRVVTITPQSASYLYDIAVITSKEKIFPLTRSDYYLTHISIRLAKLIKTSVDN